MVDSEPSASDVVDLYKIVNEQINNLRQNEVTFRLLLTTWFAAVAASIGFIIVNLDKLAFYKPSFIAQPVSIAFFTSAGLAIIGWWGLIFVWRLDIRVYHRLLDAHFRAALELEAAHPWLPRCNTPAVSRFDVSRRGRQSVLQQIKEFYCSMSAAFLLVAEFFAIYAAYTEFGKRTALVLFAVSTVIDVVVWRYLWTMTASHVLEDYIKARISVSKV
jgi:hypothetical protein